MGHPRGVDSAFALAVSVIGGESSSFPTFASIEVSPAGKSEPGLGFVLAVLIAEVLFEDAGFGAGAFDLQD